MEKRNSERVQFFQIGSNDSIEPIWVFRHTNPDAILGLLVDIGRNGAQVLTSRDSTLSGDVFQLMVRTDGNEQLMSIVVTPKWSKPEGTLYNRNGFEFEQYQDLDNDVENILAVRQNGNAWLRCELLPV